MKVCILGAGPCGLTAAWMLARNSVSVTVIEKEAAVGGLCRTVGKNGCRFDLGGHRFISPNALLINEIRGLMGDELLTRRRKSVIRFKDRQYDYPVNLINVLRESSLRMNIKFAAGYMASAGGLYRSRAPENSFEYWIDRRFGSPLNNFFFKPYSEKLWGVKASELSSDWAPQRIALLNAKDAVLKAMRFSGNKPRTYASAYLYPKKGIGAIFDKMADDIRRLGGKIITSARLENFEAAGKRISKIFYKDRDGKDRYASAENFLSTIPLDENMKLLGCNVNPLPFRSLRFLNIMLDNMETFSPNTWMYVPEPEMIMTRIQEPKQRSPFSAPSGKTSIILEIPCEQGDRTWNMPDEELLSRGLGDLRKLGFDIKRNVTRFFSTRAHHAYPRYELGYQKKVNRLRRKVLEYSNLSTLGRQGLFRYIFMDTAMLMGREWALKLTGKNGYERIDELDSGKTLLETMSVVS
ncbi:MAG: amine oxidase [bacterium]|nr:MAG: amine oxidase [bacterium]